MKPVWKRSLLAVAAVAVVIVVALLSLVWRGVQRSLDAERTLGAYILMSDVVVQYAETNRAWPSSWDDLETVPEDPRFTGGGWQWPRDSDAIRSRIAIRFDVSEQDLIQATPEDFDLITQREPNFPDEDIAANFLHHVRQHLEIPSAESAADE
ncbi:MAG: hypothetical protein HQ581_02660 [Planctomycetes bacterium]|nr:hypothetical protein [Planctomycetota bacterium]